MKRQPRNPRTDKLVNERLISMAYGQIGEDSGTPPRLWLDAQCLAHSGHSGTLCWMSGVKAGFGPGGLGGETCRWVVLSKAGPVQVEDRPGGALGSTWDTKRQIRVGPGLATAEPTAPPASMVGKTRSTRECSVGRSEPHPFPPPSEPAAGGACAGSWRC